MFPTRACSAAASDRFDVIGRPRSWLVGRFRIQKRRLWRRTPARSSLRRSAPAARRTGTRASRSSLSWWHIAPNAFAADGKTRAESRRPLVRPCHTSRDRRWDRRCPAPALGCRLAENRNHPSRLHLGAVPRVDASRTAIARGHRQDLLDQRPCRGASSSAGRCDRARRRIGGARRVFAVTPIAIAAPRFGGDQDLAHHPRCVI